jgi:hypothetical protein
MTAFQVKGVIVRGFQDLPVDQVCHCSTIRYSHIATWDADLRGKMREVTAASDDQCISRAVERDLKQNSGRDV